MPKVLIDIPDDVDKKVAHLKLERNDKNKKDTLEWIIKTHFKSKE